MLVDPEARYQKSHEWVKQDGALVAVGLSAYAIIQLGKIVYLELSEIGRLLAQGDVFGVVESAKTAAELHTPVGGTIVAVHTTLCDNPGSLTRDAYGGWMIKVEPENPAQIDGLMDAAAYQKYLETEA